MKKLNNKGITTIEVIICFILVVTITTSMYSTVSAFNQKRITEQYKEEIYTYKNLLTKEIQNDFIKIGVTHASYKEKVEGYKTTYTIDCNMRDGTKRRLVVIQRHGKSDYHTDGDPNASDYYMIKYGTPADMIDYPIPKLGSFVLPKVESDDPAKRESERTIQDLSINNIWMSISEDNNVLDIYIGFYHPELGTRYGIQIIAPIDYVASGNDAGTNINLYQDS
ncbi:MAG: hypothetical protein IKE63_00765 [Bacilli bacterium]|nr:hypothetical protein [Bacilli bacterium]